MARALRMTPATPRNVALAGAGPFGARVISLLCAAHPGCQEFTATGAGITAAFAGQSDLVVLALWRPDPGLCDRADALSYRRGRPWLPVIMEHPVIRIGPVVCPPAGPCFRCYIRRRRQHDRHAWVTAALQAAYDREQTCGPGGYLPHHARLAAAAANDLLWRMRQCGTRARPGHDVSHVTTIRLSDLGLNVGLRSSRVIACPDCDRCGGVALPGAPDWLTGLALSLRASLADGAPVISHADSLQPASTGALR